MTFNSAGQSPFCLFQPTRSTLRFIPALMIILALFSLPFTLAQAQKLSGQEYMATLQDSDEVVVKIYFSDIKVAQQNQQDL